MQLPPQVRERLEQLSRQIPLAELRRAAEQLTTNYKSGQAPQALSSPVARLAYLIVRLPATYAACATAFRYSTDRLPGFASTSMLDLGSGPGTAILAAQPVFPTLAKFTAFERDAALLALSEHLVNAPVERQAHDLRTSVFPTADLVVASYALNELPAKDRPAIIARAWAAAQQVMIVIEPGTPEGYAHILAVREQLLAAGGVMAAPCPHVQRCPMMGTKDWCHFAARVERTSLHRQLKSGALGHEDEKFSYIAFAKRPGHLPPARIVRHPLQHPGHVKLALCTDGRLESVTVTRSQKSLYKDARRARWGDAWPFSYTENDEE